MPTATPADHSRQRLITVAGGKRAVPAIVSATQTRSATIASALSKALAVGILMTPPALMLFSELNHRSGNAASGVMQGATASRTVAGGNSRRQVSGPPLVPLSAIKSER